MTTLAAIIWNPLLSFIYLELGLIFLLLTKGVGIRKSYQALRKVFFKSKEKIGNREVPHLKALLSSLAATVGVGNLAGVGTAIHLGGPGALFWMWMSAISGMSFRMVATYLALKYQPADPKASTFATPMSYLQKYMKGKLSWIPSTVAILILLKGFVTANLIQSNSVAHAINGQYHIPNVVIAGILALLVGMVLIGGLRKIVELSSAMAPWMMIIYILAGLTILLLSPLQTLNSLGLVFKYAFNRYSFLGGVAGYTVLQAIQFGVSRGVFSHHSGIGIAPFLQSANKDHPSVGSLLAAITPAVDTLIICSITGLVILKTNYWHLTNGALLTTQAFKAGLGFFGQNVVIICLVIFAFTTIINYGYYAERCFEFLGGQNVYTFRVIFVIVNFIGPFFPVIFVWSVGDVILGSLIILHLLPLTYILLKNISHLKKDLIF